MNISSFVNQITQTITDAANGNTGNLSPSALEESIRNGLEAILSKGSGQSVTGEVLQMNGNEILLSLGENQLLQARLEGGAMPRTGQLMTFQIQNMAGNKILLTPLFENLNQNSNISTALKAAGLPLTDAGGTSDRPSVAVSDEPCHESESGSAGINTGTDAEAWDSVGSGYDPAVSELPEL